MKMSKQQTDTDEGVDCRITKRYAKVLLIDEHPWFFRMSGDRKDTGLLGYYGNETASQGLVIASDAEGVLNLSKRFALFSSIDDFYHSVLQHPTAIFKGEHFYEVIGTTTPEQKPYFDVDIHPATSGVDSESFAQDLVTLIISVVREEIAKLLVGRQKSFVFPVSIYTTKYPIDPKIGLPKIFSYHLVFQGVHFSGHEQMRQFGTCVKKNLQDLALASNDRLPALAGNAIDDIWFKTRQFRLLWSSKLGRDAVKIKVDSRTFIPEEVPTDAGARLEVLRESCVSLIPPGSRLLVLPVQPVEEETADGGEH